MAEEHLQIRKSMFDRFFSDPHWEAIFFEKGIREGCILVNSIIDIILYRSISPERNFEGMSEHVNSTIVRVLLAKSSDCSVKEVDLDSLVKEVESLSCSYSSCERKEGEATGLDLTRSLSTLSSYVFDYVS